MNSVFLNYNTSYFDLLNDRLPSDLGDGRLLKSSNGKIVESLLDCRSSYGDPSITASPGSLFLNIGERNDENRSLTSVDIGQDELEDYTNFGLKLYPPTTFHNGLKFEGGSRVNSADLWVNGSSGSLKYRDRNVVSSGSAISGNLAVFGSSTVGAIEDVGLSITSGLVVLTLFSNITDPSTTSVAVDFDYQKIGKHVSLTLRSAKFQGSLYNNPSQFETRNSSGLLPEFLKPLSEISCPIAIYVQVNSVRAALTNQLGVLKIGGDIGGSVNLGNIEIRKRPEYLDNKFDADSGDYDGWSGASVSYFTA